MRLPSCKTNLTLVVSLSKEEILDTATDTHTAGGQPKTRREKMTVYKPRNAKHAGEHRKLEEAGGTLELSECGPALISDL